MRLTYWKANKNYENALSDCLVEGAATAGIELIVRDNSEYRGPEGDGSLIFGVTKREILWDHKAKNFPLLYLDKGYCRERVPFKGGSVPAWWRMCWQDVHPTAYLMKQSCPPDRWWKMGLALHPRQTGNRHVVILGSSAKFHTTMRQDDPTVWATRVAGVIRTCAPTMPIFYRPKPSWKYAEPVLGTTFDWGTKSDVRDTLKDAACSVTYGSIACVDSICAGVPCIVVGNGVAAPISAGAVSAVADPYWAPDANREQWAANLGYTNFSPTEIGDGTAWKILKETMRYAL